MRERERPTSFHAALHVNALPVDAADCRRARYTEHQSQNYARTITINVGKPQPQHAITIATVLTKWVQIADTQRAANSSGTIHHHILHFASLFA
jgi:hypothetical protein